MLLFDGEQKLSKWPKDAVAYIKAHPRNEILAGQSICSMHKFMAVRMAQKRVCISYNSKLNCFVAWNAQANLGNARGAEDVCLKLYARNQKEYAAKPEMTAFYQPISKPGKQITYQKICVFPTEDFVEFYDHYETYMTPNPADPGFQSPVSKF